VGNGSEGAKKMKTEQLHRLSPAILELARSLYRKPGLADVWNGDVRTIETIGQISDANEAAAISELMSLGLSRDAKVCAAARSAIQHLFSMVPFEALPSLDDSLRRTWGQLEDWYGLRAESLKRFHVRNDADRIYLGLIASHRNGFVREEALRTLGLDGSEIVIPFYLIRLTDWVDEVRSTAEQELLRRLEPRFAKMFVDCFALIDRLAASPRFNPSVSGQIDELLQSPECTVELRRGMNLASRSIRRHCFRIAAKAPLLEVGDVIAHALKDPDVVVRKWAFTAGPELLPQERVELTKRAARDSYGPIRRLAFEIIKAQPISRWEDFEPFLLDRSTTIRKSCQIAIEKRFGVAPADFYRARLQGRTSGYMDVAVLGIAETGNRQDETVITALLRSRSAKTRCAVIRALCILGAEPNSDTLRNTVSGDVPSVAREAALSLIAGRIAPAESIWIAASKNPDHRVRARILKLFRNVGKWMQIRLYLDAATDTESMVSTRAIWLVSEWVRKFNASFAQPSAPDKVTIPPLLESARRRLPEALVRELDFIVQTSLR
jgi:HEAT repeat protein